MTREPLLTTGALTALGAALIALVVAFGLPLTDDQQAAVLGVLAAVVPLAVAFSARPKVTSMAAPAMPNGQPAVLVPASAAGLDERNERLLPRDGGVVDMNLIDTLLILWCAIGILLLLLGVRF